MNSLYTYLGKAVVWLVLAVATAAGGWQFYTRWIEPHYGNAILWLRVFVFRKRWHLSREGARIMTAAYQKSSQLARWERNIIACAIRKSRPEWVATHPTT